MKIYVASSWRNAQQPAVVQALQEAGHAVYDFRNPRPEQHGFAWSDVDPNWQSWTVQGFRKGLRHPIAQDGFALDLAGLDAADVCVLALPCGRSAHLEAGYAVGQGKQLVILSTEPMEPELMYIWASYIVTSIPEMLERLQDIAEGA